MGVLAYTVRCIDLPGGGFLVLDHIVTANVKPPGTLGHEWSVVAVTRTGDSVSLAAFPFRPWSAFLSRKELTEAEAQRSTEQEVAAREWLGELRWILEHPNGEESEHG
jgi:hypothetical protein